MLLIRWPLALVLAEYLAGGAVFTLRRSLGKGLCAVLLLLPLLVEFAFAGEEQETASRKNARLMLGWQPQSQFAGYYMAKEKGIYARYNLEVSLIGGGEANASPLQALQDAEAEFAVLWLPAALRQEGAPRLLHLAQLVQRSSLALVGRKTLDIATLADLRGRKVGVWSGEAGLPIRIFLEKHQLQVRPVPQRHSINLFLRGGVEFASIAYHNEYHSILMSGLDADELQIFTLREHGVNLPEDGLYTLASTRQRDPAFVQAFVSASLEGWQYAFDHPEETVDTMVRIMRKAGLSASLSHQRWQLEQMRQLMQPGRPGAVMGDLCPEAFHATASLLLEQGYISSMPDYHSFVKGQ